MTKTAMHPLQDPAVFFAPVAPTPEILEAPDRPHVVIIESEQAIKTH